MGLLVFLLFHLVKQRFHSLLQRVGGQLPGLDVKGYGLFVYLFLHFVLLSWGGSGLGWYAAVGYVAGMKKGTADFPVAP